MKKLHVFILKSYLGPFILTFFITLFIILMQFLWKYVDDMVGKGLEWTVIVKLLFYASSTFVPLALPLAVLLSSLMTFGNLGERYEMAAIKAAGISLRQTMQPLIFSALLISGLALYFSNNILPVANLKMASLLYDVREKKPALDIKEGMYYKDIDNYVIKIGRKGRDGQTIHDVLVYNHSERNGNIDFTMAESGFMEVSQNNKYLLFTLNNGYNYYEDVQKKRKDKFHRHYFRRTRFEQQHMRFDLSSFALKRTNEDFFKDNYQMLNLGQLEESIDSLGQQLVNKQNKYARTVFTRFMHVEFVDSVYLPIPDSILALKPNFLANFETKEASRIMESALNVARTFKRDAEFKKDEFYYDANYIDKFKIEWHSKFTLAFACFILFFIGAPLGAIIRKGGIGWPLVISVLFFVLFHVVTTIGKKAAKQSALPPFEGMWLASFVLLPIGIYLTYKATTDAPLLDRDTWKRLVKRLSGTSS